MSCDQQNLITPMIIKKDPINLLRSVLCIIYSSNRRLIKNTEICLKMSANRSTQLNDDITNGTVTKLSKKKNTIINNQSQWCQFMEFCKLIVSICEFFVDVFVFLKKKKLIILCVIINWSCD